MTSGRKQKGGDELQPGQQIGGRYLIERLFDEGGMASIYLAQDLQTHAKVAVKCLYKIYEDNAVVRARFIDEGRIQMMLQHPNIVRVHQLIEHPTLAFVMEFVEGMTLEDYLKERGVLKTREVLEIMVPVLSALGLAHSRNIVHRDLKPSNILLQRAGALWHPKVMDFGVAKLKRSHSLTATGTTVGTLHYMSPEQIVGSKSIDGRADIYSLGITLYKLCTGEVPFNAATEFALMMAQVEAKPRPPRELNPRLEPELEKIILRALAKKPHERYQNIKEFTSALYTLKDEHGKETLDTISVPSFLLQYAMMADQVAVDKTEEISLHSQRISKPTQPATPHAADRTDQDQPLVDSRAITDLFRSSDDPLLPQDTTSEAEDGASTIEVDRLRLNDMRYDDADGNTLDMSLDPTAKAKVSVRLIEQLSQGSGPAPRSPDDEATLEAQLLRRAIPSGAAPPVDDAMTLPIRLSSETTTPRHTPQQGSPALSRPSSAARTVVARDPTPRDIPRPQPQPGNPFPLGVFPEEPFEQAETRERARPQGAALLPEETPTEVHIPKRVAATAQARQQSERDALYLSTMTLDSPAPAERGAPARPSAAPTHEVGGQAQGVVKPLLLFLGVVGALLMVVVAVLFVMSR